MGYFTFEDGSKSTDPQNSAKVKKIMKRGREDAPNKVKSAYNFFVNDYCKKRTRKSDAKLILAEVASKWKSMSE